MPRHELNKRELLDMVHGLLWRVTGSKWSIVRLCLAVGATVGFAVGTAVAPALAKVQTEKLTINFSGTGKGKVKSAGLSCNKACLHSYTKNKTVELIAVASPGSNFSKWTGACAGTKSTCAVKMGKPRTVTATFAKKAAATLTPRAGSYSDASYVSFYVSYNHKSLQDITAEQQYIGCTPGGTVYDGPVIPSLSISSTGRFGGSTTRKFVVNNVLATATYTFSGHFTASEAAVGTFKDTVTYNNGKRYSCSTGATAWTATYDAQGTQAATAPPAGSYSGSDDVGFYVSPDHKSLEDVVAEAQYVSCTPGGEKYDGPVFASIPIQSNGSFAGTATNSWIDSSGDKITSTYTFDGHFHGFNSGGAMRAAGEFSDTVRYSSGGVPYLCTTGNIAWSGASEAQGSQRLAAPLSGSYSGSPSVAFSVESGGRTIDNFTAEHQYVNCTPGGSVYDGPVVGPIPIQGNASFARTATNSWTGNGNAYTSTYTVVGHFHGFSSGGEQRAAGLFSDTITYSRSGTDYTCRTGLIAWSATS
jgi:Divergent InlB B-repeat domain